MSKFLEAIKESGIVQKLRGTLTEEEKKQFDEVVKKTMKEYGEMWTDVEPLINKYNSKVKDYADQPESEQRSNVESDNE
jgi:hypothetical protein